MKNQLKKGDVFYAELPDTKSRVIHGRRPVVIVSDHNRSTISVIPMTTTKQKRQSATHVHVGKEHGLRPSTVLAEQIQCVDRAQLCRFVTHLPEPVMGQIQAAVFSGLGFQGRESA